MMCRVRAEYLSLGRASQPGMLMEVELRTVHRRWLPGGKGSWGRRGSHSREHRFCQPGNLWEAPKKGRLKRVQAGGRQGLPIEPGVGGGQTSQSCDVLCSSTPVFMM